MYRAEVLPGVSGGTGPGRSDRLGNCEEEEDQQQVPGATDP